MIDQTSLFSWESIFAHVGLKPLRRGRGSCPFCDSKTGFSCNDVKGFNCFACNAHGDKISFIQQFCRCDFKNALRFFGIEPGEPPAPDPIVVYRQSVREGLHLWANQQQRKYRDQYYLRSKFELLGKERLTRDHQDPIGWEWLAIAYKGMPLQDLENLLDLLNGRDSEQLLAYEIMRIAS
jgi:hypothetical protein